MTPKEKAQELFDKYSFYTSGWNYDELAKQCALIAVNEILKQYWSHDTKRRDWWKEVKKEIEKI